MRTSVIRYRVADFLKQYPPFDCLPEDDLLEIAGSGRVTFHESDEELFQKGQPVGPSIRVIQQGKVEIVEGAEGGRNLRDVLGEGEILGLERFLFAQECLHTAMTASDVILYSLDAGLFEKMVRKHPAMSRYLAAHFSVTARYAEAVRPPGEIAAAGGKTWADAAPPSEETWRRGLVACREDAAIREVARRMAAAGTEASVIVDAQGRPTGWITARELSGQVATGLVGLDRCACEIAAREVRAVPAGLDTAACLVEMMRGRRGPLAVTEDGTTGSRVQGVLTESDLALACGRNPVLLAREMFARAEWIPAAKGLLAEALSGPPAVERCAGFGREFQAAVTEGVIRRAEGKGAPTGSYCWLLFGWAGRGEALLPAEPELGMVYAGPQPDLFASLASNAGASRCLSLAEWKQYYSGLIRDPIGNSIYDARAMFDLRPLTGEAGLAGELAAHVLAELGRNEVFIRILANDTLAQLPPLTFFQGMAIAMDGASSDRVDLATAALDPIVDAARVFALAGGAASGAHTIARLQAAAAADPESETTFLAAMEAFRVFSYHAARAGLAGEGTAIDSSKLNRYDQRLLKTAFSAVHDLLQWTISRYGIPED